MKKNLEFKEGIYKVNEIFSSIQGEGRFTGHAVTFVRFSVCNLECLFCDTDFDAYTEMSSDEIVFACESYGNQKVVFTGGEPLLQLDDELADKLCAKNFGIHVETNGSLPLPIDFMKVEHISMSPKQCFAETALDICDDVKVLFPYFDGIKPEDFEREGRQIRIQPIEDKHYKENLAGAIKECHAHGYVLSVQVHKVIGVE